MPQSTIKNDKLHTYFSNKIAISRKELYDFYQEQEGEIHWSTLDTRIRSLKRKKVLQNIGRGYYSLQPKDDYFPLISKTIIELSDIIQSEYSSLNNTSIWHTSWLNEFSIHQNFNFFYIIEVDKDMVESIFYHFKDMDKAVFLQPDKKAMEYYVSETADAIVLKPLVSRAPTKKIKKVSVPKLEKILVDVFCEQKIHFAHQNTDLIAIYQNAAQKYHLNYSTLIGYARRREKSAAIGDFIVQYIDNQLEILVK